MQASQLSHKAEIHKRAKEVQSEDAVLRHAAALSRKSAAEDELRRIAFLEVTGRMQVSSSSRVPGTELTVD